MKTVARRVALATVMTVIASPAAPAATPIPAPADRAYPGEIVLEVDASDVERRIVHVHEHITGLTPDSVLLYPKWLPGTHAPEGPIDRLAGIRMQAGGQPVRWLRDTVNIYAFRPQLPPATRALDIDFDYLSPTSARVGSLEMTHDLAVLGWHNFVLYPAGYYVSRIPVTASLTVPAGWQVGTALERASGDHAQIHFGRASLETVIDSPVFAGHYARRVELDAATGVSLDVFADRADQVEASPAIVASHRALVTQAYRLFGSRHYAHYDFLVALTDQLGASGTEHHQSSEDVTLGGYLSDWDTTPSGRDLLAHELTHSWNGKFRRPADLWTPNYDVPMQNSLLWVYEGQTQYWGLVLTARAGMWTPAQALDEFADEVALQATMAGRRWRPLQDTTNDEIINPRRPMSWPNWQRYEDYYQEGALYWLEADCLIRERTHGQRSLDDFARRFFGRDDGRVAPVTYTFSDVIAALNDVAPYDWATFFRERLDTTGGNAPLDTLRRSGYELTYTDQPGELWKAAEAQQKAVYLQYSIGLDVEERDGTISAVAWDSPAYKAGLSEGMQVLAINGTTYSGELLKRTITEAQKSPAPIVLILKQGDRYLVASIDYTGGLRYPRLQRRPDVPALLDDILRAK